MYRFVDRLEAIDRKLNQFLERLDAIDRKLNTVAEFGVSDAQDTSYHMGLLVHLGEKEITV